MRRSINAIALALAAGILSMSGPVAGAATSARPAAAPRAQGRFGVRLVDVPVSEARNPRAYRYIIDYLPAGAVIHRRILIVNDESRPERFSVYPGAAHIAGGLFVGDAGATRNELTTWISVRHTAVTLAPGASAMDRVTIKVPRRATRGEHYGVIWVQQTAKSRKKGGFGITEISRVGIRVYLAVGRGGMPPTRFDIASITGRRLASGQLVITAHVANTGGRAIDLNGSARLTDGPGNTRSGPFLAQKIVTLAPGQSSNVTFAASKSLPSGSWRARVSLASGMTTAGGTAAVRFAAVQAGLSPLRWIWLALGGLALVLVLVMGRYAWQHRHFSVAR
ncbi:MAG: peptidase [Jatrophihabitans sp.]|uniref:peptidase n=1 Tax=Jatrophihabitans sp. TaxID=1932789 RepID=UPI003F815877